MILTILLSCSTAQVKIESVDPELSFPYFPDPFDASGSAIPRLESGNVIMPQWYWIKITEYVVEVEKCREVYEAWRGIYVNGNQGGLQ